MRPKDLLMATYNSQKGTVVIIPTVGGGRIFVCGASCRTNATAGECVDALTVVPEAGCKDVVALEVSYSDIDSWMFGVRKFCCFLLEVTGGLDKPVNLENEWVSSADRLATAVNSSVVVEIDGVRYIGREYPKDRYYPSGWYVDPNLLCKYLVGKATAEEVKAVAREFRKDEPLLSQKEQKELQAEVERLNTAFVGERNARQNAEQLVRSFDSMLRVERKAIGEYERTCAKLGDIARHFFDATRKQWFKSWELKRTIQEYSKLYRGKNDNSATK